MAAAARAANAAGAEAAAEAAEAAVEKLAAEPATHVIKNDLRPTAKACFSSNHRSRPGTASGIGTIVPFGVDGMGGYYGAGCGAAAPGKQPPLPTPCLSHAAQVGSTAQYSSRSRRAAAVAANLAVGAPVRRGDRPRPATAAAATVDHARPEKPRAVFAARPVLENEFIAQMSVALDSLAVHSWGSSVSVMSQATTAAQVKTHAANASKAAVAAAKAEAAASQPQASAAAAAAAAPPPPPPVEPTSTAPPPAVVVDADVATTTRPPRPPALELPPDSAPGTPRGTPGRGQAQAPAAVDSQQQRQPPPPAEVGRMPRWSEKTLRASEQQERRRATTARASAAISVSVPFSPSFLNNNNVEHLTLTAHSISSGVSGVGGGSSGRGTSAGRRLVYAADQRPATAEARLGTGTGMGTGTGTRGRGDRPGSTGRGGGASARISPPPPSMTHRGQPSRPVPPPTQWAPVQGWSPGGKHSAASTAATGGFKPWGASLVSGQPRFAQPRRGGGAFSGRAAGAAAGAAGAGALGGGAHSQQSPSPSESLSHMKSTRIGDHAVFSASRRRPATAQPAARSGRPVSGSPRRRVPPGAASTSSAFSPSSPQQHQQQRHLPGVASMASRPRTSGGLVGHRGQSVGGGWYYPVVPAGATSAAAAPPPPKQPPKLQQELHQMAPAVPAPAPRSPSPRSPPPPSPPPNNVNVRREPLPMTATTGAGVGVWAANGGTDDVDDVAAALAAVMAAETAARNGGGAPGVHSWSITSPWDQAAGAGESLYQDARSPPHVVGGGASGAVKDKSPGKTRLVGAASLGGLPTEMDFEVEAIIPVNVATDDDVVIP
jgi:hypothetical protein